MKLIFWDIDAMGWFEPVKYWLRSMPQFSRDNLCIRPNLENAITEMNKMGYSVIATTCEGNDYAKECLSKCGLSIPYIANIQQWHDYANYLPFIKAEHTDIAIIGSRPRQQPNSSYGLFIYDHKPHKKDAMINAVLIKTLEEIGDGKINAGFTNLLYSNEIIRYGNMELSYDIYLDGMKLDLQKENFISTIIVDEQCKIKK